MNVDFRKLRSFVKIVDAGSVSRAAGILHIAQPALSQQIAALEEHFKHKLLIRSNHGVVPTEAGLILYRHAQLLLKQIEQAKSDIDKAANSVSGRVSIGLATYSTSNTLSLPILKAMKARHPDVVIHINDSFGFVLSELIMTGKMDMAVIYGSGPIKGVLLEPLFREELFLVTRPSDDIGSDEGAIPLSKLDGVPLLLPSRNHFLRRLIDEQLARARVVPTIVSELESVPALGAAVMEGLGATILPASVAEGARSFSGAVTRRLVRPVIEATVSLCTSDHLPLSEPAIAAKSVLFEVVQNLMAQHPHGIRPAEV